MTPIFMRIWLMKITIVFERLMLPVSLRSACDIRRACSPICVLGAFADPREIAYAELVRAEECSSERQPGRIRQCPRLLGCIPRHALLEATLAEPLGHRQIEAEKIAVIVGHRHIVTCIDVFAARDPDTKSSHT